MMKSEKSYSEIEVPKASSLIGSFDKGLSILGLVVHSDQPLRLQEVANALEIDKSSALRYLATLEKHRLVERNPYDKTYAVGTRLAMWSENLKAGNSVVEVVRPFLKRLTAMTMQTSHLAVLRDDRVVLIEVMPSESAVSVRQTPGDWEPMYCTAVGKAILGFLPTVEQRRLIDQMQFRQMTPTTVSSSEMLWVELRRVVRERMAFDEVENNPRIGCIATPILDRTGYPIAAIGISTISDAHPGGPRAQKSHIAAVRLVAEEVMELLNRT
jgi:DNA-binding IclR family transcriptional regulator